LSIIAPSIEWRNSIFRQKIGTGSKRQYEKKNYEFGVGPRFDFRAENQTTATTARIAHESAVLWISMQFLTVSALYITVPHRTEDEE
jgi:hypothetical protein